MGLTAENPFVGGTVLRRAAEQSPNYAQGSAGWIIRQDGSAEFNNLTVRDVLQTGGTLESPTILGYAVSTPRGPYFQSFEDGGTDNWTGQNASVANDATWASDGNDSLKATATAAGAFTASSPPQACSPGDTLALAVDLYNPNATALNDVYVGLQYLDANHNPIYETDLAAVALASLANTTLIVTDNAAAVAGGASADAAYYVIRVGDSDAAGASGRALNLDNVNVSGNLAFSASVASGTDSVGNDYDQGIEINGLPGLVSAFSIQDAWGQDVLASIDGSGNITGQTVTANDDVFIDGQSLTNDILPPYPQGLLAYGYITNNNLPTNLDASGTLRTLYELDQQVYPGRTYAISLGNCGVAMSATGNRMFFTVKGTQDGSTPSSTNGDVLLRAGINCPASPWYFPGAHRSWRPPGNPGDPPLTLRTIVTVQPYGASGQVTQAFGSTFSYDDSDTLALTIEDIGENLGNNATWLNNTSGGGGTGTQTYTKYYNALHTYSYAGSDGHYPNTKLNTDGRAYQGGNYSSTFNGKCKTWCLMPSGIASDLSGATINWVKVKLNNNHTWYNSGMTVALGWDTKSSFGSTAGDPSGSGVDAIEYHINAGATLTKDVSGAGIGTGFQSGGARSLVLFKNSNNLNYYGYFAGGTSPQLIINYTK